MRMPCGCGLLVAVDSDLPDGTRVGAEGLYPNNCPRNYCMLKQRVLRLRLGHLCVFLRLHRRSVRAG